MKGFSNKLMNQGKAGQPKRGSLKAFLRLDSSAWPHRVAMLWLGTGRQSAGFLWGYHMKGSSVAVTSLRTCGL